MGSTNRFLVEVVSDTICPWCYIGKQRLKSAIFAIGHDISLEVRWRPFELNPGMPRDGLDRKTYRAAKFGSWDKSLELDAQVKEAGAAEGLDFHHERIKKTPNTLASHVLIQLAVDYHVQDDVVEALFCAYFVKGKDVGDPNVLAAIAARAGVDSTAVEQALNDEDLRATVRSEARAFLKSGINGVPTVLLNRFSMFSGAQQPDFIENALRRAATREDVIASGKRLALA